MPFRGFHTRITASEGLSVGCSLWEYAGGLTLKRQVGTWRLPAETMFLSKSSPHCLRWDQGRCDGSRADYKTLRREVGPLGQRTTVVSCWQLESDHSHLLHVCTPLRLPHPRRGVDFSDPSRQTQLSLQALSTTDTYLSTRGDTSLIPYTCCAY
jgi:hypothetical protein